MVECSSDCPNYYDCDGENCEFRDEYIDATLSNGEMIPISERAKDAADLADQLGLK